jgi:hypothetical protein
MQLRSATILLITLLACSAGMGQSPAQARAGDVAEGVVTQEGNGVLLLNVTPCKPQAQLLQFHNPYRRRDLGQSPCPNGGSYAKSSVEQQ